MCVKFFTAILKFATCFPSISPVIFATVSLVCRIHKRADRHLSVGGLLSGVLLLVPLAASEIARFPGQGFLSYTRHLAGMLKLSALRDFNAVAHLVKI